MQTHQSVTAYKYRRNVHYVIVSLDIVNSLLYAKRHASASIGPIYCFQSNAIKSTFLNILFSTITQIFSRLIIYQTQTLSFYFSLLMERAGITFVDIEVLFMLPTL